MWSWLAESKDTEEVQIQRVNYKLYTSPCVVQGSTVQTISLRNYQLPSGKDFQSLVFLIIPHTFTLVLASMKESCLIIIIMVAKW